MMQTDPSAKSPPALAVVDPVWQTVRHEAEDIVAEDPTLSSFIYSTILNQDTLEASVAHRVAERLRHPDVSGDLIRQAFRAMYEDHDADLSQTLRADIVAVYDRDPACTRFVEPLLYFKGFHAVQAHRLAHWSWHQGRHDFALYMQSRASQIFQVDINPETVIGRGLFLDHATGVVLGATARIGDDCSILQGVTLGGTGKETGDRHPKIGNGVLIGANAIVLGNIPVGDCARVAAGSMVLKPVEPRTTVAGVPARVVGVADCMEPSRTMNQLMKDGSEAVDSAKD